MTEKQREARTEESILRENWRQAEDKLAATSSRERVLQSQLDSIIDRQLENENLKAGIANAEERERVLRKAANTLIDYIGAHGWGSIPEPYDSINPLLKLLGRGAAPVAEEDK